MLVKRGDYREALPYLRTAVRLNPDRAGVHQQLADAIARSSRPDDPPAVEWETIIERSRLYQQGAKLMPTDAETSYQLGKHLQMSEAVAAKKAAANGQEATEAPPPPGGIGRKTDEAAAAWRHAIALKPDMAEAYQMLALRMARARGKKMRERGRKLAAKGLKIAPHLGMSGYALGMTHLAGVTDFHKMAEGPRGKAIKAFTAGMEVLGSDRLSSSRRAEALHHVGLLKATAPRTSPLFSEKDALEHFTEAVQFAPSNAQYAESLSMLEKGIDNFKAQQQARAAREAERKLKELQEEEEAEWEADEKDEGFSDIR